LKARLTVRRRLEPPSKKTAEPFDPGVAMS